MLCFTMYDLRQRKSLPQALLVLRPVGSHLDACANSAHVAEHIACFLLVSPRGVSGTQRIQLLQAELVTKAHECCTLNRRRAHENVSENQEESAGFGPGVWQDPFGLCA